MAEQSLSALLKPESASPDDLHPLSPSLPAPRRAASYHAIQSSYRASTLTPRAHDGIRTFGTPPEDASGYFDLPRAGHSSQTKPAKRVGRSHAATISSVLPHAKVTEADLLGIGPSELRSRGTPKGKSTRHQSPIIGHGASAERDQTNGIGRPKTISGPGSGVPASPLAYTDSLTQEEAAVVEMRFDLMTDEELDIYLRTMYPTSAASSNGPDPRTDDELRDESCRSEVSPTTPRAVPTITPRSAESQATAKESAGKEGNSPLFPPSPPNELRIGKRGDHPLRILGRAVRELREEVTRLALENEELRADLAERSGPKASRDKQADTVSTSIDVQ